MEEQSRKYLQSCEWGLRIILGGVTQKPKTQENQSQVDMNVLLEPGRKPIFVTENLAGSHACSRTLRKAEFKVNEELMEFLNK